jgi:subtilase family serine protease
VVAGWATKPHFARNGGVIPPGFDSGSGGGASANYARPSWQQSTGVTGSTRLVPDISSLGDPTSGFTVYSGSGADARYRSVGGTSLATPVVASLVAISKAHTGKRIGLATPWLYKLQGTSAIRDVVPTSAGVWSSQPVSSGQTWPETIYAWDASPQSLKTSRGWDPVSGIGMPTGKAFLDGFGR